MELKIMKKLKKESRKVNEIFWEHFDMLKQASSGSVPEQELMDESFRFATTTK